MDRHSWGREWLDFHDECGRLSAIPIDWTDRTALDPFVVVAAGRCHLRFAELLRMVEIVATLRKGNDAVDVRGTMPQPRSDAQIRMNNSNR